MLLVTQYFQQSISLHFYSLFTPPFYPLFDPLHAVLTRRSRKKWLSAFRGATFAYKSASPKQIYIHALMEYASLASLFPLPTTLFVFLTNFSIYLAEEGCSNAAGFYFVHFFVKCSQWLNFCISPTNGEEGGGWCRKWAAVGRGWYCHRT